MRDFGRFPIRLRKIRKAVEPLVRQRRIESAVRYYTGGSCWRQTACLFSRTERPRFHPVRGPTWSKNSSNPLCLSFGSAGPFSYLDLWYFDPARIPCVCLNTRILFIYFDLRDKQHPLLSPLRLPVTP